MIMETRLIAAAAATSALLLGGCASLTAPARLHKLEPGQSYWFDYDASRRGMVLTAVAGPGGEVLVRSCAEPAPDIAFQMAAQADLRLHAEPGPVASGGGAGGQAARLLSERSQMVMFFREALFRVCELSLNQNLSAEQLGRLYDQIISTALKLGSDKAFEVDLIAARAELERAELARLQADKAVQEREAALQQARGEVARMRAERELETAQRVLHARNAEVQLASRQVEALASQAPAGSAPQDARTEAETQAPPGSP